MAKKKETETPAAPWTPGQEQAPPAAETPAESTESVEATAPTETPAETPAESPVEPPVETTSETLPDNSEPKLNKNGLVPGSRPTYSQLQKARKGVKQAVIVSTTRRRPSM